MSEEWNTKYGTRRVRYEPPTLTEAIFAASGLTDDLEQQAAIAAELTGIALEKVQAEINKSSRIAARTGRVVAFAAGTQRAVVVERRPVRGRRTA